MRIKDKGDEQMGHPQVLNELEIAKKRNHANGVIATLVKEQQVVIQEQTGYWDADMTQSVSSKTVFGLASVTKMFTAMGILILQEQGKLRVTDYVVDYLPQFTIGEDDVSQIQIHHFLTHTSGFPPLYALQYAIKRKSVEPPYEEFHSGEDPAHAILDTYEELMTYIASCDLKLIGKPGAYFSYSNEAYSLLGAIIEKVSGETYRTFIQKNILEKANLHATRFKREDFDASIEVTEPFRRTVKGEETITHADPQWADSISMRATGFLKSNTEDMLQFLEIYLTKGVINGVRILSEDSMEQLMKPHIFIQPNEYYGYGIRITKDYLGHVMYWHGGSLKSVSSAVGVIPAEQVKAVVFANTMSYPAIRTLQKLVNVYTGEDVNWMESFDEPELTATQKQRFVGRYVNAEETDMTITEQDGNYQLDMDGETFTLYFKDEQTAYIRFVDSFAFIPLVLNEANDVIGISYGSRVVFKQ